MKESRNSVKCLRGYPFKKKKHLNTKCISSILQKVFYFNGRTFDLSTDFIGTIYWFGVSCENYMKYPIIDEQSVTAARYMVFQYRNSNTINTGITVLMR